MGRVSIVLSLLPLLALSLFYSTWLAAAISLQHWPIPSLDDPKAINGFVSSLRNATCLAFLAALLNSAVRVAMLMVETTLSSSSRKKIGRTSNMPLAIECFGWLVIGAALVADPGNVLLWFMD